MKAPIQQPPLKIIDEFIPRKATPSTFVCVVSLEETGEEIEVRRLSGGGLVGFDAAYLSQLCDIQEHPNNPYDDGVVLVPFDEETGT